MLTCRFWNRATLCKNIYNACKTGSVSIHRSMSSAESFCQHRLEEFERDLQLQIQPAEEYHFPFDAPEDAILNQSDFFKVKELVSIRDLFNARVHYGHKSGCRNQYMREFLYGSRMEVDIFDLDKTLPLLHDALNIAAHMAYRKGPILFVSRNVQTLPLVEKAAKDIGEYSHCRQWDIGHFTDAIHTFAGEIRLPDLVIFFGTKSAAFEQHVGVVECAKLCIPTIGIVDSNCDPRLVTYPVPGNDDTPQSIELYLRLFKEAINRGKAAARSSDTAESNEDNKHQAEPKLSDTVKTNEENTEKTEEKKI